MPVKKKHEEVKDFIENKLNKGYKLISEEYINSSCKLKINCPVHGEFEMRYGDLQQNHGCPKCSIEKSKHSYKEVKDFIENKGYKLISEEYINFNSKLQLNCPIHGEFLITYHDLKKNHGCRKCYAEKRRFSYEEVRDFIENKLNKGYKLISEDYMGNRIDLKIECPVHGEFLKKFSKAQNKLNCPKCSIEKRRLSYEEVRGFIENKGYKLISEEYINNLSKLEINCPNHGSFLIKYNDLQQNHGCPKCGNSGIGIQTELENIFKQYTENIIINDRTQIKPLELDFYFPDFNLAIEYCGLRYHNEDALMLSRKKSPKEIKNYHKNKFLFCKEKGIKLITIFEDEWINKQNQILSLIKSNLQIYDQKIPARKCEIKEVTKEDAKIFINNNHIQGYSKSIISFGLYFKEELIGVVSGSNHHRNLSKETLILNRMCFKEGIQIQGGASKLLSKLKNYAVENNYKSIKSWSDNRYSNGNVYEKLGFILKEELDVDYSYWTNNQIRQSKQSNQKKHLLKKGATGETEFEMAKNLGYSRIWDCGKKVWELIL